MQEKGRNSERVFDVTGCRSIANLILNFPLERPARMRDAEPGRGGLEKGRGGGGKNRHEITLALHPTSLIFFFLLVVSSRLETSAAGMLDLE